MDKNSTLNLLPHLINSQPLHKKQLLAHWQEPLPIIHNIQSSQDGTVKFLLGWQDGQKVETVLIPFGQRYTVCLSTQVGCALKCSFCFTGMQGLSRHLLAGEIVGQYLVAWDWLVQNLPEKSLKPKIVFMGQGEPLHNFVNVKSAIEIFLSPQGLQLGPRQITLSTAGYLPGMVRFAELGGINLALSLHSANDDVRSQLIPINKMYPLQEVLQVLAQLPLRKRQFINFEYLLLDGLNNSEDDAAAVAQRIQGIRAIVNLIPFNEFPGSAFRRPSRESVLSFQKTLFRWNIFTTIRTTKGDDILAACGQLNVSKQICNK